MGATQLTGSILDALGPGDKWGAICRELVGELCSSLGFLLPAGSQRS